VVKKTKKRYTREFKKEAANSLGVNESTIRNWKKQFGSLKKE